MAAVTIYSDFGAPQNKVLKKDDFNQLPPYSLIQLTENFETAWYSQSYFIVFTEVGTTNVKVELIFWPYVFTQMLRSTQKVLWGQSGIEIDNAWRKKDPNINHPMLEIPSVLHPVKMPPPTKPLSSSSSPPIHLPPHKCSHIDAFCKYFTTLYSPAMPHIFLCIASVSWKYSPPITVSIPLFLSSLFSF